MSNYQRVCRQNMRELALIWRILQTPAAKASALKSAIEYRDLSLRVKGGQHGRS